MTNGNGNNDRTAQSQRPMGATVWASSSNIWGTGSSTALPNRESIGSRGSPKEPITDTADDSWRTRSSWNNEPSQTRNTSGSTSPNRTRDTVNRNLSNTSPYFTTTPLSNQSAIGQRAATNGGGRWNPTSALESSPRAASRPALYASSVNDDQITNAFGVFGTSSGGMRAGNSPPVGLENIEQRFGGLSLSNVGAPTMDNGGFPTLNRPGARREPFQFNPSSQAWETSDANGVDSRFRYNQGGVPESLYSGAAYGAAGSSQAIPGSALQPARDQVLRPGSRGLRSMPDPISMGRGRQGTPPQHNLLYGGAHFYDPAGFGAMTLYTPQFTPNVNPRYSFAQQPPYLQGHYNSGADGPPHKSSKGHDPADAQRSQLLREYRQAHNSNRRFELRDIYGHIVEFAGDQYGSRFIQEKLTTANSDEKDQLFNELESNAMALAKDIFGNYVIQKLFDHCNQIQKKLLAQSMKGQVATLSFHQYGCRVVQKAVEVVLVDQLVDIVKELEPEVLKAIKDQHGNHVIQKVLQHVPRKYLGFIYNAIHRRAKELCCNQCACRVVQKALDHGTEADTASIVDEVLPHTRELANDQFGNYVVTHILKLKKPEYTTRVINAILGDIVHLSRQKHASNVIEQCDIHGTPDEKLKIEAQFTTPRPDGTIPLQMMVGDQYANYVIQKHIGLAPNKTAFIDALRPHVQQTQNSSETEAVKRANHISTFLGEPSGASIAPTTAAGQHSSPAPASPLLQMDMGSAAPTPNLTNEPNSPSSSTPSTTDGAVDEPELDQGLKAQATSVDDIGYGPEVRVEDS
ncbi:armadillo-type protein [Coniochaeta sp. 2T2.1]|nr:armadillo-type protein [Coniochaeta sp. 2T2.1]